MEARAAMPIPTPMPIDAAVERPELETDVEVGDDSELGAVEEATTTEFEVDVAEIVESAEDGDTNDGDDEDDVPCVEVGDEDEENEPELELPLLISNRDTGGESVWPSVALGLLLQAALIASRTICNLD
jgi:hypothetical protein